MLLKLNPDSWQWILLSIFAVWRLTTLLCYEAGPFHLVTKFRKLLYKIKMGSLIDCFHCTGIWISVLFVLSIYQLSPAMIVLIPGVAGGVSVIEKVVNNFSTQKENTHYDED